MTQFSKFIIILCFSIILVSIISVRLRYAPKNPTHEIYQEIETEQILPENKKVPIEIIEPMIIKPMSIIMDYEILEKLNNNVSITYWSIRSGYEISVGKTFNLRVTFKTELFDSIEIDKHFKTSEELKIFISKITAKNFLKNARKVLYGQ